MPPLEQFVTSLTQFLKKWEGCNLKAYIDQHGRITIGWGHTGNIQLGTAWSQQQADEQLQEDVTDIVNRIRPMVKVNLTVGQSTAVSSFSYNLGPANFSKSGLLKFINREEYSQAANQFPLWCYIGLYRSAGLLARRNEEKKLFQGDLSVL
jgi:lysozyme